ncbi:4'-phosphopantetheinyl transferase superfamily protein [Xanthobacter autotrophicus]|uniref:4'-phosphopantetheinyl transferase family protein n=1 Tax=Xanthobacter TaxID=279 RepID=UPI0024AC0CD7|nr:4'-phosphopantetheinyl transferase superfamily protein [Xanthobacter autotrophicus]MDI4663599.1 4'-phosphopantetheinyl transferase superfamily protein [Xanthobacter autotrophicus]
MGDAGCAGFPPPGPGEVLIVHGFTGVLERDGLRERLMACLTPEEEDHRRAFVFPRDRDHFLLAHALKRLVLGRCLGVAPVDLAFRRGEYGKPCIAGDPGAGPGFSLSHSGGAVVLAVALSPLVGVDVEAHDRDVPLPVLASIMADEDVADLAACAPDRRKAFAYWTLREAFAKAVGIGLSLPRNDVCFRLSGSAGPSVGRLAERFGAAGDWQLFQRDLGPGHLLAAAVRSPTPVTWHLVAAEQVLALAFAASDPAR